MKILAIISLILVEAGVVFASVHEASIVSHGILSPSPSTGQQGETKGGRSMNIASHGSMYDTVTSDGGRRIDNPTGLRRLMGVSADDTSSVAKTYGNDKVGMEYMGGEDEEKAKDGAALRHRHVLKKGSHDTHTHMNATRVHDIENGSRELVAGMPKVVQSSMPAKGSILQHRALNIHSNLRWKDRSRSSGRVIIPYSVSSRFGSSDISSIRTALDDLERRTGSLEFVQRSNQGHYISVVRKTDRCSSSVGKVGGGQTLNLGKNCMSRVTIQHEFMHAMGFEHEHTRPDRNQYVTILTQNIENRKEREHNFDRHDDSQTLGSPYDYNSIMHYSGGAFSIGNTKTIVPKNGAQIGQPEKASDSDIKKLKLLYQCEKGIVRDWNSLINNPCTSDCKCREGETGCGSDDDACHGSLVCSSNKCVIGSTQAYCGCNTCTQNIWDTIATDDGGSFSCGSRITWAQNELGQSEEDACSLVTSEFPDLCRCNPSCEPTPSPTPSHKPFLIWQSLPGGASDDFRCMDLRARDATNGNDVWYYPCNFSPAQYWYRDSNTNYIRSSIDRNKCLVGAGGSSTKGTRLVINDCHNDDDRFRWDKYTDDSIRPRNNKWVCIEADINAGSDLGLYLILDDCHDGYKAFYWQESENSRRRQLLPETEEKDKLSASYVKRLLNTERSTSTSGLQGIVNYGSIDGCLDSPIGWFDIFGRNCEWYSEVESNCAIYGDQYKNFGKTALSACCVCGGGPSPEPAADSDIVLQDAVEASQFQSCWDLPSWYDSTGDGCVWYEEENNCEYYGNQFPSDIDGQTANEACCTCGGGLYEAPPPSDAVADTVPGCSDTPFSWFDDVGIGCDWYAIEDRNCIEFGEVVGADGRTPNEVCCACGGGFDSTRDSNQAASLDRDASDGLFAGTVSGSTSLEYPSISPAPPNPPSASPSISPAHFRQLKADHHSDGEPASATVGWGYRFPRVAITAMIALALAIGV